MNFIIYKLLTIILSLLNTYITYRMMQVLNKSYSYNKRIEFLSYISFSLFNIIFVEFVNMSSLIVLSVLISLFALSFNYNSKIMTKIFSVLVIVLVLKMSEVITVFFMQHSLTATVHADGASIHFFIYCRIIDFVTLVFMLRLEDENIWAKKTFLNWYSHIISALFAVIIEFIILSDVLTSREVVFNMALIIYILAALIYLYFYEQSKNEKNQRKLKHQLDNYHIQYNMLMSTSHLVMEMHYNLKEHLSVMRQIASRNEQIAQENKELISYIDGIALIEKEEHNFIQTGNLTTDSILSMTFTKARKLGIDIRHDILIPSNLSVNDLDMTTILAGTLNSAIDAIRYYPRKKIDFSMKYEKGMLIINISHANTVTDEERKKYKFVYPDDINMRAVEKTAEKYSGGMSGGVNGGDVYVMVMLIVPDEKTVAGIYH